MPRRRSAADALDAAAAREFLDEGRPEATRRSRSARFSARDAGESQDSRPSAAGGAVTVTFRLDPALVKRLRVEAAARSIEGIEPRTQQAIVAAAIAEWLDANGQA